MRSPNASFALYRRRSERFPNIVTRARLDDVILNRPPLAGFASSKC